MSQQTQSAPVAVIRKNAKAKIAEYLQLSAGIIIREQLDGKQETTEYIGFEHNVINWLAKPENYATAQCFLYEDSFVVTSKDENNPYIASAYFDTKVYSAKLKESSERLARELYGPAH